MTALVQTSAMTRPLLIAILALALSACGFHLRNALTLPTDLGPVRVVSGDPYSPLAQSLARALERAGAQPVPDADPVAAGAAAPDAAMATLNLLSEKWADTPISVDQFGRAQEFTLRHAVVFDLRRADGSVLVPQQAIELGRDYVAPPANSLGRSSERELLVRELRQEMVAAILRRIDAVSHSATPAASASPSP